ncbi:tRNA (adenosine(37)-N6)-threonylcarbamoyltransferase complex dimerization subunit type 1 TsaB [Georgenia sp. EYE_87]|uniref:tRNA (adenosine(37)-N6)-threonylcarbamoyltransferase complex dimerization subunit type 1 TsaB n=1 Tax=Georgenia sp. EYE_87 TaxID=2853448 RepID=UPI0020065F05|nr:tRNA (adenosine(37)-N6)-threonylcarbamoyltransferase complex dimerization subunit type 1 TsaB [Georgenia sp. EYE_87]MCK6209923.1 tRNA (adenosine(37)-N6)-threonylcarbamoyltransferase complex dimerization subunit type 1 TsaB [Georgenia sp. EYE_87]
MHILSLDTSAGSAVALVETGPGGVTVLDRAEGADPRRHAETLAPLLDGVLAHAPAPDAVAVGTGPAPFTGLRAGLVTAHVFARGRGIEVHGVCSLDALARQALDALDRRDAAVDGSREVLVVTDARRKEVYWGRYRADGPDDVARLAGPEVAAPAVVAETHRAGIASGLAVAGAGAVLYPEQLPATADLPVAVDPAVLARIVAARLARRAAGEQVELGTEPRYLRRPDVHTAAAPKRAS